MVVSDICAYPSRGAGWFSLGGDKMLFSHSDIELLRLAGWCKSLPSDISGMFSSQVFDTMRIQFLVQLGLVNMTRNGQSLRLREKGWRFIRYLGYPYHKDAKYKSLHERRVEIARILLTFWRAGFQVFACSLEDLGASQVFLSSMAARRGRSSDIWGGAVFRGLARIGQSACACYYVGDSQEQRINYRGERFTLDKAVVRFSLEASMLLAGSDYVKLARAVRNTNTAKPPEKEAELTLPQLRQAVTHPLYLLECGEAGALQLLIMSQPDHRKRLAAMLRSQHAQDRTTAPPPGVTAADGMLEGKIPWVSALDMDIHRLDKTYRQTMAAGCPGLTMLCLNERAKAALELLYDVRHANIVVVPEDRLVSAFGVLHPYQPKADVYVDTKGGIIHATHLPID